MSYEDRISRYDLLNSKLGRIAKAIRLYLEVK